MRSHFCVLASGVTFLFLTHDNQAAMNPKDDEKRAQLRQQLNDTHTWPCAFKFKFIVPSKPENEATLRAIFGQTAVFKVRDSSKGNYRALTVDEQVSGPEDIFARYEAAQAIPGIVSL